MTIYDIAKACGVSIATVSRVLNNSDKVSERTRAKVLAVMQQENYTPNPFARGLGLDSMKMIGLVCTDVSDAFYAKAVSLIEHELKSRGLDMMLVCTGSALQEKKKYLQFLLKKHVDAIILIGSPFHEDEDSSIATAAKSVPVIAINSLIDLPHVYSVLCDEASGMELVATELARAGYRDILYLYDSLSYSGQQKLKGYRAGLAKSGIATTPALELCVPRDFAAIDQALGALAAKREFSAVIAAEDYIAIGAQKALARLGQNIPVIGCNNSQLAECATPALTSLDNRLGLLCPAAVDILTKILESGEDAAPSQTVFPAVIEYRESFRADS